MEVSNPDRRLLFSISKVADILSPAFLLFCLFCLHGTYVRRHRSGNQQSKFFLRLLQLSTSFNLPHFEARVKVASSFYSRGEMVMLLVYPAL